MTSLKQNISLFWKNILANKYWLPIVIFVIIQIAAAQEEIRGVFDAPVGWFVAIEGFSFGVIMVILIMAYIQRDSQK
jgi:uncharacterized membrane protein